MWLSAAFQSFRPLTKALLRVPAVPLAGWLAGYIDTSFSLSLGEGLLFLATQQLSMHDAVS